MKVILTGGGTGGHIYPAIAIADKIKEYNPDAEILFVGTQRGLEKTLVPKNGYPIEFITVSGFNRRNLLKNVKTVKDLAKGNREAKNIVKSFKPDVVIGTGGYVCGPMVRAAAKLGVPTYIHEQNAFPGLTNKLLEKHVKNVFLAFEEGKEYFKQPEKHIVTGNPVRKVFYEAERMSARKELGIPEDSFVVLSFGGSQGASKINNTVFPLLEMLNGKENTFLVYATGKFYYDEVNARLKEEVPVLCDNVRVLEYIDNMALYLAAADVVVSRSGALAVTEITVCGRAAILVPSPNVTGNHQYFNAKAIADKGGAILIEEKDFNEEVLIKTVFELMNDKDKVRALEEGSRNAAPPDATEIIYNTIFK
ncbi:MAG: undecaprenyldiphospho-muramoylpentapeptide beta-N-acetylglucosaminyltransferase [Firmicutes bacterium]|nr:undecaprenyldiphospho-muramoylpentapeptide beta-N-acetylglucosaminyltransferase [Bacillota bacterium]MBQ9972345.1 undecaprenyldiphospho-muramoylpentapeptide beta-N-acetylglucosaminyltransferase [Bacillota bacterium]